MSPKGLKAPPAFAATTILTQAMPIKRGLPRPTASTTAHITSAVVRLSMIGDRKKLMTPVIQKSWRKLKPLRTSQERSASKTRRSLIELT